MPPLRYQCYIEEMTEVHFPTPRIFYNVSQRVSILFGHYCA
jgi:hypothetical protein